ELPGLGARGVHLHAVRPQPAYVGAEMHQQGEHRLDVADVRHVVDPAGPVGEQRRREDRKGRVLVAGWADRAFQGAAARDRKGGRHGSAKLCGGLRRRQAFANVRDVNVSPVLALAGLAAIGLLATRLPPVRWRHLTTLDPILAAGGPLVLLGLVLGPGIDFINRAVLGALPPVAALETAGGALAFTLPLALHRAHPLGGHVAVGWLAWLVFAVASGALVGTVFLALTRQRSERADVGFVLLATLLFGAGVGYAVDLS